MLSVSLSVCPQSRLSIPRAVSLSLSLLFVVLLTRWFLLRSGFHADRYPGLPSPVTSRMTEFFFSPSLSPAPLCAVSEWSAEANTWLTAGNNNTQTALYCQLSPFFFFLHGRTFLSATLGGQAGLATGKLPYNLFHDQEHLAVRPGWFIFAKSERFYELDPIWHWLALTRLGKQQPLCVFTQWNRKEVGTDLHMRQGCGK